MSKKKSSQKGFSLIEVMVALGISAVLYVGGYNVLVGVLQTTDMLGAKSAELKEMQRVFHFMQRDMEQMIARPIRSESGEQEPALNYAFGSDGGVEFTRLGWRNPINRARSDLQRVAYLVEDNSLYRKHWLVLDRDTATEPRQSKMLEGVEEISVSFYDPNNAWVDQWPPGEDDAVLLPSAVEVTLITEKYGELRRKFRIVENYPAP